MALSSHRYTFTYIVSKRLWLCMHTSVMGFLKPCITIVVLKIVLTSELSLLGYISRHHCLVLLSVVPESRNRTWRMPGCVSYGRNRELSRLDWPLVNHWPMTVTVIGYGGQNANPVCVVTLSVHTCFTSLRQFLRTAILTVWQISALPLVDLANSTIQACQHHIKLIPYNWQVEPMPSRHRPLLG